MQDEREVRAEPLTRAARRRAAVPGTRRAASRRRRGRRRVLTIAVAALVLAGGAAALWSGTVPSPLQLVGLSAPGGSGTADPAGPTSDEPVTDPPAPASADERLLSTVDQCWALARGELAPGSASYQLLVASAGGSDLEAWCADLTGAPARTAAAS